MHTEGLKLLPQVATGSPDPLTVKCPVALCFGAVYDFKFADCKMTLSVAIPPGVEITEAQAKVIEQQFHDVLEGILARNLNWSPQ